MKRLSQVALISLVLLTVSQPVRSAVVETVPTKVIQINAYGDYGDGDVVFSVENPRVGCEGGFWLKRTDPGFKAAMSVLLTARTTGMQIVAYGYDDQIWGGSSTKMCRLYNLRM